MIFRIFFLLIILQSCDSQKKNRSTIPIDISQGQEYDFEEMAEAMAGKKIVALGESSHGVGNYYSFKAAIVEYLHKHHGFEVLAFEAGLGDLNLAWSSISQVSGIELMNQTIFGNFRCEEIQPLFDYIKNESNSERPLIYSGFDNQLSSSFFTNTIQPIINNYDEHLADSLEYKLEGYVRWFRAGYYEDSITYKAEADAFISTAKRIQEIISDHSLKIQDVFAISDFDLKIINQTCRGFIRTVELPYAQRHRGSENRDSIMFDNFQWLIQELYPNKKVIIWAHNAHIERESMYEQGPKWMGHYLAKNYGDHYYSLGLFAREGEAYQQWGDTIVSLDNTHVDNLESLMLTSHQQTSFLNLEEVDSRDADLHWVSKHVDAFENENGGEVSFVPKERFDGIVVFRMVNAPKY